MLEGIHILSQEIDSIGSEIALGFGGIFLVFSIVILVFVISSLVYKKYRDMMIYIVVFVIFLSISVIGISKYNQSKTTYTVYKITIDDSVKLNEFNSKYNIVSQDGEIYTITLKEEK